MKCSIYFDEADTAVNLTKIIRCKQILGTHAVRILSIKEPFTPFQNTTEVKHNKAGEEGVKCFLTASK